MKSWYDRTAPNFPRGRIGGDEPLPHDGLQNLRQDSLVVSLGVVFQDVPDHHRVRYHDEGLGPEAKLVRRPELFFCRRGAEGPANEQRHIETSDEKYGVHKIASVVNHKLSPYSARPDRAH